MRVLSDGLHGPVSYAYSRGLGHALERFWSTMGIHRVQHGGGDLPVLALSRSEDEEGEEELVSGRRALS